MRVHWAWRAVDPGVPGRQAPVPGTVRNPAVDSELPSKFLNTIEFLADTTRTKLETGPVGAHPRTRRLPSSAPVEVYPQPEGVTRHPAVNQAFPVFLAPEQRLHCT